MHGEHQTYYPNGNKKSIGKYINGKEDGLFTTYFNNGSKSSVVTYKNGQKIGKATFWNDNKLIRTVENYVLKKDTFCSVKDGEQLVYAENGTLIEKGSYVMGSKEGLWLNWYDNGVLMASVYYSKNLPNGETKRYGMDGKITSMIKVDSARNTLNNKMDYLKTNFEFNKTGLYSSINYFNGDQCFKRIQYYENNIPNEIQYLFNLKNEQTYSSTDFLYRLKFHDNGKLKGLEILYHNQKIGRALNYYYNGNLKSIKDYDIYGRPMDYDLFWASDGSVLKALHKDSAMNSTDTLINHFYKLYNKFDKKESIPIGQNYDRLANPAARSFFKYEFGEKLKLNLFYPNGNKILDCYLGNLKTYGPFKIYHANGKVFKEETEHFGKYNDTSNIYFPSGYKSFMDISLNKKSLEKREWYDSGQIKMLAFYLDNKMHGAHTLWYPNGKIESEFLYDSGQILNSKGYFKNGQLKTSTIYTSTALNARITENFNIDGIKTQYEEWIGYKQNGPYLQWWGNGNPKTIAWFKNGKSDSIWTFYNEDGSFNKEIQYKNGYSLKSFSQMECECLDTTSSRISYAPGLKDLVSQTKLREWSFNFHAPIDEYLNRLFYKNLQFNNNGDAIFASFDLLAFEKLNIKIPNNSGLELCLNPCYTKANSISSIPFNVNINNKDKAQTRVNIYPKCLSIQFSKNLFHRWDTALLYKNKQVNEYSNTARQFDVYLPSPLLFKAKEIRYNKDAHFEVSNASDICFPKSEIGHSGVSIDFNDFTLDLDVSRNPYQIDVLSIERYGNYYYYGDDEYEGTYSGGSSRGYGYQGKGDGRGSYGTNNPGYKGKKESALSKFVGVFIDSVQLGLPKDVFNTDTNLMVIGRNTLIENNYIISSFALKAKVGAALFFDFNYKGKNYTFIPQNIENRLKEKGFYKVYSEYDKEKSEYVFFIYFKAN
jgi:antitoxin component YwqK of YwqJK toxin-antitoxin module